MFAANSFYSFAEANSPRLTTVRHPFGRRDDCTIDKQIIPNPRLWLYSDGKKSTTMEKKIRANRVHYKECWQQRWDSCFLIEISEMLAQFNATNQANNDGDDDNDKTQMANNLIKATKSFWFVAFINTHTHTVQHGMKRKNKIKPKLKRRLYVFCYFTAVSNSHKLYLGVDISQGESPNSQYSSFCAGCFLCKRCINWIWVGVYNIHFSWRFLFCFFCLFSSVFVSFFRFYLALCVSVKFISVFVGFSLFSISCSYNSMTNFIRYTYERKNNSRYSNWSEP